MPAVVTSAPEVLSQLGVVFATGLAKDGSTDDTTALQAAINATPTNGVCLLPKGQIVVSRLDINKAITLAGWGEGVTFLCPSADQDCIRFNAGSTTKVSNILVRDLHIAPKTDRVAGAALLIGNVGDSKFEDVKISGGFGFDPYLGILVENASNTRILAHVSGCAAEGIKFSPNATAETGIVDVFLLEGSFFDSNTSHGISITNTSTAYSCEGIYIERVTVGLNGGDGVRIANSASCVIKHIFLQGTIVDQNTGVQVHVVAGGAEVSRVMLDNVWVSGGSSYGIYFAAQAQLCEIKGGRVIRNAFAGITCDGADDITISTVDIYNNGTANTNTWGGIWLKTTPTNIKIIDCSLFNDAEWAGQQNGIDIDTGTNIVISGGYAVTGASSVPFDTGTATGIILDDFTYGTTWALATTHSTPENVTTTNVGNVGGGTDDLMSYSLPASTLKITGQGVRIRAWGTTANNANPKTVALLAGATTLISKALTVSQAGFWEINAVVFKTGTDTQDYAATITGGGTATLTDAKSGTATEDDGAAIVIKCTGTVTDGGGGINNDDIVQGGLLVECIG